MNEIEASRVQLFNFLYAFCGNPIYAGYLWDVAGEQTREAYWTKRSIDAPAGEE